MSVNIVYNTINVNSISTNSPIAMGENAQPDWDTHSKVNEGSGGITGVGLIVGAINLIVDDDVVDTPISDSDFVPSSVDQQL
ncbi:hypothetical protein [Sporohalobacter salinus]|uniref:hypothetical protein n=1 Tax=Sporohalobacter salinus TaxID=1494606 RepID=UPI001961F8B5|nr:hypothetical protein [Sporohalobacter salinus]MBM7624456.1 hypothetical protein [Sporohalobacter salinus]